MLAPVGVAPIPKCGYYGTPRSPSQQSRVANDKFEIAGGHELVRETTAPGAVEGVVQRAGLVEGCETKPRPRARTRSASTLGIAQLV